MSASSELGQKKKKKTGPAGRRMRQVLLLLRPGLPAQHEDNRTNRNGPAPAAEPPQERRQSPGASSRGERGDDAGEERARVSASLPKMMTSSASSTFCSPRPGARAFRQPLLPSSL